jgi:hypothetical protein
MPTANLPVLGPGLDIVLVVKVHATLPALLLAGVGAIAGPGLAVASTPAPSRAQIRQAVRRAESSRDLWTTVNICNAPDYADVMGIRGQMPALGFATSLFMRVQVDYWSKAQRKFEPDTRVKPQLLKLGDVTSGLHQGGVSFLFSAHAGRLTGTVRFTWERGGKVIGQAERAATGGHPSADYGHPKHHSSADCTIP